MTIYQQICLPNARNRLTLMLVLSSLAHLIVLSNIYLKPLPILPSKTIKVALKTLPITPQKAISKQIQQMVSPSHDTKVPNNPHYLSDQDSSTAKEQIKRGQLDAETSSNSAYQKQSPNRVVERRAPKTKPIEESQSRQNSNPKLFLDSLEMEKAVTAPQLQKENNKKNTPQQKDKTKIDQLRNAEFSKALPFERQSDKGLFAGPIGSPDYLPNIPDGDITLLNSKADQFAVFVRRVALQVFGAIKRKNWQELSASELRKLRNFSSIHAKMNKAGQLISVELQDSSGSILFDELVKESVELSARDQNPPAAAAADDGNIHFIFKSRSWSRSAGDRGLEQRWILLGTGLL